MHQHALLKLLSEYSKQFPQEQDICSRFIHFVNCEPDCLKRTLKVGHVTASSWVLSPDCNEVLLTHHRKLGFWVQLGGHVDGQTEILQAALREAREESGIPNINPLSESLFYLISTAFRKIQRKLHICIMIPAFCFRLTPRSFKSVVNP